MGTLEERLPNGDLSWGIQFSAALNEHRRRVANQLQATRDRLRTLDSSLEQQYRSVAEHASRDGELEARDAALRERAQELTRQSQELAAHRAALEQAQQDVVRQQTEFLDNVRSEQQKLDDHRREAMQSDQSLRERETELNNQRDRQIQQRQEIEQDRQELARQRQEQDLKQRELEFDRTQLRQRLSETHDQRRRIASELRAQRSALQAERAEAKAIAVSEGDSVRVELTTALRSLDELRRQLESERDRVASRDSDLREVRAQVSRLEATGANASESATRSAGELASLRRELTDLQATLTETEKERDSYRKKLAEAPTHSSGPDSKTQAQLDDLHDRCERAEKKVKQLEAKNHELTDENGRLRKSGGGKPAVLAPAAAGLDWESQKRRLLEQLESDEGPETAADRMSIEATIKQTDAAIAERDTEIIELKRLLEQQSSNIGSVAVGAAAFGRMLDQDELVQEERENLRRLQEEWHEKMRQAELDISMERAKLARERTQMEERLQSLEAERSRMTISNEGAGDKSGKGLRGRWLARLGLNGDEKGESEKEKK